MLQRALISVSVNFKLTESDIVPDACDERIQKHGDRQQKNHTGQSQLKLNGLGIKKPHNHLRQFYSAMLCQDTAELSIIPRQPKNILQYKMCMSSTVMIFYRNL
jgi:hypothetical protein